MSSKATESFITTKKIYEIICKSVKIENKGNNKY